MTLDEIKKECEGCHKCPLGETRTNLVFGVGNENASLMFVGEAPGEKEDLSGILPEQRKHADHQPRGDKLAEAQP